MVRKTNPDVVATMLTAKKHDAWRAVAQRLSGARRKYSSVNLHTIDAQTKAGDTVVVLGKVLGSGDITKKVRVCALDYSDIAKAKLADIKAEAVSLKEEISKNPKAEGVMIL